MTIDIQYRKPKVLVVDEWFPVPLDSGKKIRTFNLVKRLSQFFDIAYLGYAKLEEIWKVEYLKKIGITPFIVPDVRCKRGSLQFYAGVAANFFEAMPFATCYNVTKHFVTYFLRALETHKPDLVHCEWSYLAPILSEVREVKKVIAAHNVEYEIWTRLGQFTKNPVKRLVCNQQAQKVKLLEQIWYTSVDCCIAVSERDRNILTKWLPEAKIEVVDNGVDIDFYKEFSIEEEDCCTLVFVASFDTFSNQDAVQYFLEEILPIIDKHLKLFSVIFIGKDPPTSLTKYSIWDKRIVFTGRVDDVRPLIQRATLSIVPLRVGGGSRLKILESMAMGKAIVSTTMGAEGLEIVNGKNIVLADSPKEFVEAIISLLDNPEKRRAIGRAARETVCNSYDWAPLADKQRKLWQLVLQDH
jgi:polysaccharide biosynthesis protein PslH